MVYTSRVILVPHAGHTMSDAPLNYTIDIANAMGMSIFLVRVIPQLLDISDMSHWTAAERKRVKRVVDWKRKKRTHELEYKKIEKHISLVKRRGVQATSPVI